MSVSIRKLHFLNWKKCPPDGNLTVKRQCKEEDHSQDLCFSEMKNCQNLAHNKGSTGTFIHCLKEKLLSNYNLLPTFIPIKRHSLQSLHDRFSFL